MDKEQFCNHLELILNLLKETKSIRKTKPITETSSERKQVTNQFMSRYLELYLSIKNNLSLKSDEKYQNFIEQSKYFLSHLTSELNRYVVELEKRTNSIYYDNEWETIVCPSRSAIEAVKEIYQDTSFKEFYEGENPEALILDTEDLDDSIEMKAHKEGYLKEDQIPKGIPTSHWWWWSPQLPPANRE